VDPFILGADVPVALTNQLRRFAGKAAPAAAAKVTSKVARSTGDIDDAQAAVKSAEEHLRRVRGRAEKAAADNGGVVPSQHVEETVKAQRQLIVERDFLEGVDGSRQLKDHELEVLQRSGRRNPQVLPKTYRSQTVKRIEMRQGPLTEAEAVAQVRKAQKHKEHVEGIKEMQRAGRAMAKKYGIDEFASNRPVMGPLTRAQAAEVESAKVATSMKIKEDLGPKAMEPEWRGVKEVDDIEIQAKTVDEVASELEAMRRRELVRDTDWALEYSREADGSVNPLTHQRMLFGPDDMEQAGDAFNHLVRTGGEGVDDVYITPAHAEYSWDPGKVTSQLEWGLVDDVTKTEAQMIHGNYWQGEIGTKGRVKATTTQLTLDESAARVVARQEDRIRRALGAARRIGDKGRIAVLEEEFKLAKRATKKVTQGLTKEAKKAVLEADTRWTGAQPESLRQAGKLEKWIKDMPYRFTQALYPDSYHLTSDAKLGQMFAPLRAPVRWLETYAPAMAEQMRLSMARYDHHVVASQEIFHNVLERSGVMGRNKAGKPVLNRERSEMLYDLLDTRLRSKEHIKLAQKAPQEILDAHDQIRKLLDDFADQQGITGTSRYLEGYMRHTFDGVEIAGGARPLEFLGLSGKAEVFVSHLMKRRQYGQASKKVDKDLVMILDLYNRAARRKHFLEPMYHDLIQTGLQLTEKHGHTRYANYLKMTVDMLQGKRSVLGKVMDHVAGAKV
ncbi:MAG: hypothetical protein ACYTGB_20160, partial [Planctomycetota bacterium]